MSSLADSFLDDLDELNDSDDDQLPASDQTDQKRSKGDHQIDDEDDEDSDNEDDGEDNASDGANGEDDMDIDGVLLKMIEAKATNAIGILRQSNKYKKVMEEVQVALSKTGSAVTIDIVGILEDDPEYLLILTCNKLVQEIDDDIASTHRLVADLYAKKFPELESLIQNKIDYIRTVQRIGNEMDMTVVDLRDLLPASLVMIVSVTGSTTSGKPLLDDDLTNCIHACDEILHLDEDKASILDFIESRMTRIAPNTCALISARIAAHVVGIAGGIIALSKIPSCNIQVLGQEKRHLAGFSTAAAMRHTGVLYYCDIVQSCPPFLRKKMLKIVAGKVALLARVDSYKSHPDGAEGIKMRKEIETKIEKFQEAPKARTKKALPIPIEKKRSKRGGKRVRRLKERYAMTEMRTQQNRITFSTDVGEYGDSAMGFDVGMVGHKDTGKVRAVQKKEAKITMNKKQKKAISAAGQGQTHGLSSSLVFTPVQGLELVNPNAAADKVKAANNKWFNSYSGFLSAAPK